MAMTLGDYVLIGGRSWKVKITEITETATITDTENAGRVIEKGAMTLDRIGTFIQHKVTFIRNLASLDEFDALFNYLSQPRNTGIAVSMVHNQGSISYNAYVGSVSRALKRIDPEAGKVYWDKMSVSFIPMEAQVTP